MPLGPIVSGSGTFYQATAKHLAKLLAPLATNDYTVRDTFSFVDELRGINTSTCYMVNFDVESLFTNVPFKEINDIILHKIYRENIIATNITEII